MHGLQHLTESRSNFETRGIGWRMISVHTKEADVPPSVRRMTAWIWPSGGFC